MNKGGKSFQPKKDSVTIAVIAAVAVAIVVGTVVNVTVPRNVFPSEVVNPARSGNVIIPENASDPDGNASFSPKEITVVLGVNNTVIWENRSVNLERVIGAEEDMPGGFDEVKGLIPPGGSWAFTFTEAGSYDYLSDIHPWLTGTVIVKGMEQQEQEEIDRTKPQVDFTLYTTGNYPCIMTENVSTPSYKVAVGNPSERDVIIDMVVSARNADVSWDESTGFNQSSTKRITVLAGTPDQNQMETFYIRPHSGTGNLSLSMTARAVEPVDVPVSTYDQKIIAYFKNDAGNYCH